MAGLVEVTSTYGHPVDIPQMTEGYKVSVVGVAPADSPPVLLADTV